MLRGHSPAASAADAKMSPPPGWVASWCANGGSKLLQRMQQVQFCMLPWADPQALHEMMRQGVSRCVADAPLQVQVQVKVQMQMQMLLLLHGQDSKATRVQQACCSCWTVISSAYISACMLKPDMMPQGGCGGCAAAPQTGRRRCHGVAGRPGCQWAKCCHVSRAQLS